MTQELALKIIVDRKPKSEADLLDCGFTLKQLSIGMGAFRRVYLIVGTGLVVKVPQQWSPKRCRRHSVHEVQAIRKVQRAKRGPLVELQTYMPEIYYYRPQTGLIVMKRYKGAGSAKLHRRCTELSGKVRMAFNSDWPDISSRNCGIDIDGSLKILDGGRMFGLIE